MFLIDENNQYAQDQHGQMLFDTKPELGFDYAHISYSQNERIKWISIDGEIVPCALEQADIFFIEEFISRERERRGITIMAVDSDGRFLGTIRNDDERIAVRVFMSPPNGDGWVWRDDQWIRAYGFDENGAPCHMDSGTGFTTLIPPIPAGGHYAKWSGEQWECIAHEGIDPDASRQAIVSLALVLTIRAAARVMVGSKGTAALAGCLASISTLLKSSGIDDNESEKLNAISNATDVFLKTFMEGGNDIQAQVDHEFTVSRISGFNPAETSADENLIIEQYVSEHE
jgi:hypothetical protein